MTTAIDSCVIIDIFKEDPLFMESSRESLKQAYEEGDLVISSCVIAEVFPIIGEVIKEFITDYKIHYIPNTLEGDLLAGEIYSSYLTNGGKRGRIVPDFLIASHAYHHADRLLTRDNGFNRSYFPKLVIFYES